MSSFRRQNSKVNLPPPPVPAAPPPPPPSAPTVEGVDEETSLPRVFDKKSRGADTPTGMKRKQRRASRMGYGRVMEASLDDIAKASVAQIERLRKSVDTYSTKIPLKDLMRVRERALLKTRLSKAKYFFIPI